MAPLSNLRPVNISKRPDWLELSARGGQTRRLLPLHARKRWSTLLLLRRWRPDLYAMASREEHERVFWAGYQLGIDQANGWK